MTAEAALWPPQAHTHIQKGKRNRSRLHFRMIICNEGIIHLLSWKKNLGGQRDCSVDKALVAKPDYQSSIPMTHMEGGDWLFPIFWPPHGCHGTCNPPHTQWTNRCTKKETFNRIWLGIYNSEDDFWPRAWEASLGRTLRTGKKREKADRPPGWFSTCGSWPRDCQMTLSQG